MNRKLDVPIAVFFTCLGISLMILADLFTDVCPNAFGYADEVFGVVCLLLSVIKVLKKKGKIPDYFFFLFWVLVIGCIGNAVGGIQQKPAVVLTDLFLFIKPYVILFYFYTSLDYWTAYRIYRFLMVISKGMMIVMAIFAAVTMAVPLGMRTPSGTFQFLSGFSGAPSWWTILFFAVIISDSRNNKIFYYLLSLFVIIQTGSGLGFMALALAVLVYFFVEIKKEFRWIYLLMVIPICLWIGHAEITEYLLNIKAPRFLLFYYAFVTANTFFPFGAGFATYGSSTAVAYYSELYYNYGFDRRWGMSRAFHPFLMDSYFPQIIGQFGYLGTGLYTAFLISFLRKRVLKIPDKNCRRSCLYLFVCWGIAGLGFGTASSWGCTTFLLLPIFMVMGE